MTNTLLNPQGAVAPSPRIISNLKKLARAVKPGSMYCMVNEESDSQNVTLSFRVPLDKN